MVGLERLLIGRALGGRYTVEEQIGRGRGGLVYRARDAETGAEVAVKVLAAPQSAEARERYRRVVAGEVRSAAAIQHPNVLAVHALGTDEELNLDFVVLELARGQTLASVLAQRGAPPVALGLRLLGEAAEGLGAGHRAGLVHRDLRPASLYLVRSEPERQVRVKVGGFGVPQIVRRDSLMAAPPEVSAYASPELLMGGSARLTPVSDVFGLGVVGFQLMTGALPYDDAARRALAEGGSAEVALPSELSPAVPPHVFEAILQALRIAPAERFADSGAFAEALRQPASRPAAAVPAIVPAVSTPAPEAAPVEPEPTASQAPEAVASAADAAPVAEAEPMAASTPHAASETTTAAAEPEVAAAPAAPADAFVALPGGLMSMDDAPAEAPAASADPSPASEPAASIPPVVEAAAPAAPAPEPIAPAASAPPRTRPAPKPKVAGADLELYYPPQLAATPAAASRPGEAPAAPVTAQASIPAPPVTVEVPAASPATAESSVAPETSADPIAPLEPIAPRAVSIGGRRKFGAGAGSGGFRGSAAAGFVLGMLVLGTVGWMATRRPSSAPQKLAANQPASTASAPAASAPATGAPTAEPQRVAVPISATAADSAEARRLAREEARKRQEDEARKRQQDEQARLALQQQQAAAQAQQAPPQPAARPQAAPPPVQQPVAVAQRPAAPAPPPPAPPPAAPAREEPAPAASNEVYDVGEVEQRPRLANAGEIQRALQSRYPGELASSGVSGNVTATFVVNPDGRVDPSSIRIVSSPNSAFNAPTQSVLRRARFRPATVRGQPVRVQVSMPVQWTAPQ